MKHIITKPRHALVSWICHEVSYVPSRNMTAIGVWDDKKEELAGVVGYDGMNGASCEMFVAGHGRWLSKDLLKAAFTYPFEQMGLNVVVVKVSSANKEAQIFDEHVGFEEQCRLPGAYDDGDMIIYTMLKDECRWLELNEKPEAEAA